MEQEIIPLTSEDLAWTQWAEQEIEEQARAGLALAIERLDKIKDVPHEERTVDNTLFAIDVAFGDLLELVWKIDFLMNVSPSKSIREKALAVSTKLSKDYTDLQYDECLYEAVAALAHLDISVDGPSDKLLADSLRDFKRLGFGQSVEVRNQIQAYSKKLQELGAQYSAHLNAWDDFITITPEEVVGLSATYLSNVAKDEQGNYIVTTKYPDYFPFMETAADEAKRQELQSKFFRKGGQENIDLLTQAVSIRKSMAQLLGYTNFVDYTTEVRMAKTAQAVKDFITSVAGGMSPLLKNELEEMTLLKRERTGNGSATLESWDVAYYSNELLKQKHGIDTEIVKEYFPLTSVLEAMFAVYSELFSLVFEKVPDVVLWHEDVALYKVTDTDGKLRSYFALDLHPREGKYGHAAEFPLRIGRYAPSPGMAYAPLAAMVTNFPKATSDNPSLMPHDQVETLFHEFGHVMHENLSLNRYFSQSGTIVSRDFVEAPSQMLEYWVWEPTIIKRLTRHYKTGEPMPEELIEKLVASKNHGAGWFNMRQMVLALFDYKLHTEGGEPAQVFEVVWKELLTIGLPEGQLYPAGFGHMMGGYEAGYYGYMWSQVYAADMFSRFKQEGILNSATGMDYRQKVLSKGSSRDELDSVRDFLGRDISNEAFLKELGI